MSDHSDKKKGENANPSKPAWEVTNISKGKVPAKFIHTTSTETENSSILAVPIVNSHKISTIIATRPDGTKPIAQAKALELRYPAEKYEIIIARGKQPSVQRNRALQNSSGDLIYFLDDDSLPSAENLLRAAVHFAPLDVQIVGGPNLCPTEAPSLEQAFAAAMGNKLAFGPSAARYRQIGKIRETSEKELILCNMMVRKSTLLKHGGFDEALYPNEENALMDDIQKAGGKLIYDPDFVVYRRPRGSLGAFIKMLMNYGRGRAEQFRLHPTFGSAANFVPPLFCAYLLSLPFLPQWGFVPLALYALIVALQIFSPGVVARCHLVLPLITICHIFYGLGFWRGLFTRLKPKDKPSNIEVTLETISPA